MPALCLWAGWLVGVLRGFASQTDHWQLLTQQGWWDDPCFPVIDQAIDDRLADAGTAPMEALFAPLTSLLAERLTPFVAADRAPFATAVVALDESDRDRMARLLPTLRALPARDAGLLGGTLASLFDLRLQQWRRGAYRTDARQNEKVVARAMVADLPPGTLIVAGRPLGSIGSFGFAWFDDLTDAGYWWLSRLRAGTSYEIVHTYYHQGETFDGLVWLGNHRADRATHAVRLVPCRVGEQVHTYLTNVRDPQRLPMTEVARVDGRWWDFELAIKLVKRELGLHRVWHTKPVVIAQQVWAVLSIAQIRHALRCEVTQRAKVDVCDVSLPLLVRGMPRFAAQGGGLGGALCRAGRATGFIRPSRRGRHDAPTIPAAAIIPLPVGTILERVPRYAQRKCPPRKGKGIYA